MGIQSNINQTLSVAGFLFQSGLGKDIAAKRQAEKDIATAQDLINREEKLFYKRYEKWESQEPEADIDDPEDTAWKKWKAKEPVYETDLALKAAYQQYNEMLEKHQGTFPELGVQVKRDKLAYEKERQDKIERDRQKNTIDPTQEARDTVDELIEKYAPSTADQMADKAADALSQEQDRVRGMSIDRRKIHRQSNRERNRIRANKKNGGMTNG